MVNLAKVAKGPSLTEQAYDSIKELLLAGRLEEGARLTEEAIATQLGISKSPVREALNRLESQGLIVIEARRGAFVRSFTVAETRHLYELREVLEVYAVATARVTPELLRELEASVERTQQHLRVGDKLAHVEEDMHFHGLIASAAENAELKAMLSNLQQKSLMSRSKTYHLSASSAPISHYRIFAALKAGDREEAVREMRSHIAFVRSSLLAALEGDGESEEVAATV